jgi:hypothetical protein
VSHRGTVIAEGVIPVDCSVEVRTNHLPIMSLLPPYRELHDQPQKNSCNYKFKVAEALGVQANGIDSNKKELPKRKCTTLFR